MTKTRPAPVTTSQVLAFIAQRGFDLTPWQEETLRLMYRQRRRVVPPVYPAHWYRNRADHARALRVARLRRRVVRRAGADTYRLRWGAR